MNYFIYDLETDGLKYSKIHVLSYLMVNEDFKVISKGSVKEEEIADLFSFYNNCTFVGHNVIQFDNKVLRDLVNVDISYRNVIDTLALSWVLFPKFKRHGLEAYGERFKLPKVEIEDWENLSYEDYKKRCERDVEITLEVFKLSLNFLKELYGNHIKNLEEHILYLSYNMNNLAEQADYGIHLDKYLAKKSFYELEYEKTEKAKILAELMPRVEDKRRPVKYLKKDGTLSKKGEEWISLLKELNLPENLEVITKPGNPGSHNQLKDWLFSLGWKPETFKENEKKEQIPQISLPFSGGICPSVKRLYDTSPNLKHLENFYVIRHRSGIFKSFLESVDDKGKIYAQAGGLTKTLRLKHSNPIVNLPKVSAYYGQQIRACLSVPSDKFSLVGIDISGLEDYTKQHYIYYFDPEYVKQMQCEGYDPHLNIALLAELMTPDEELLYKEIKRALKAKEKVSEEDLKLFHHLDEIRSSAKVVNFASTYKAGVPKLAFLLKDDYKLAERLHSTYWKLNWAIEEIEKSVKIVTVKKTKWIFNPVSKIYYFLENDKDIFSALNQSTGSYVFNKFLWNMLEELRHKDLWFKQQLQYHDRQICRV